MSLRRSFDSEVPPGTSPSIVSGTYELVSSEDITESTNPVDGTVRTRGRMVIVHRDTGEYAFYSAWIVKGSGVVGELGVFVFSDGTWCHRWRESCIQGMDMRVVGDEIYQYARGVNFAQVSVWRRAVSPPRSPRLDKEILRQQQRARQLAN